MSTAMADMRGIEHTAHQFQRWVPKSFEARVIVVGDRVFTAAIHAGNAAGYLDWRNDYDALRYQPITPPQSISAGAIAYCAEFGTGYNAALMSHRLGDQHVFSVDIGTDLVQTARERLAELGYAPTLAAVHGAQGLPEHASFDRIIATCSVPAIPGAWADQLCDGGLLLVDVKRASVAGNLVLLRKQGDRLQGRFLPTWAGFMAMRDTAAPPAVTASAGTVHPEDGTRSFTRLEPTPWAAIVPWLLASPRLPWTLSFGYLGRTATGAPEWAVFTGDDGSWCAVRTQPDNQGHREVRQDGPVTIWDQFERTHGEWETLDQPGVGPARPDRHPRRPAPRVDRQPRQRP